MSIPLDSCYTNVIGITLDPCECVDDSLIPVDYYVSKSGLFFDQLPGIDLVTLNNLGSCNEIWTLIQRVISQGVETMKADAMREILKKNLVRHYNYSGQIGSIRKDTFNAISSNYGGVKMYCNPIRDGYMKINRIGVIMQDDASFDIDVLSSISDSVLHTIHVVSTAGRLNWNTLATPIILPLWNDEESDLEYGFIYDSANIPADNSATCNCRDVVWCYDKSSPCFAQGREVKDRWRHWVMCGGVEGDYTDEFIDWNPINRMNGLVFDVQFYCNQFATLCNSITTDFQSDAVDHAQATAVWYKAGEYAMREVLKSPELNVNTMTNREAMINYVNFYISEYQKQIEYVAANIDIHRSGCLACRDNYGFSKRTIYL